MQTITLHLGLDVHKDSITIAEPGSKGEIRLLGTILNSVEALERALTRIGQAHPGAHRKVAYEAGPCGFVIARRLKQLEVPCLVAASSLIPKQPGSPFKTDKRDARSIARLLRAGELTAVYVPEPTDEAIRDLRRARTDAVDDQRRCRSRLKAFLLMRTGLEGNFRITREYRPTNRVNKDHPPPPLHLLAVFGPRSLRKDLRRNTPFAC